MLFSADINKVQDGTTYIKIIKTRRAKAMKRILSLLLAVMMHAALPGSIVIAEETPDITVLLDGENIDLQSKNMGKKHKTKTHQRINGQLLQMNKRFSSLKKTRRKKK